MEVPSNSGRQCIHGFSSGRTASVKKTGDCDSEKPLLAFLPAAIMAIPMMGSRALLSQHLLWQVDSIFRFQGGRIIDMTQVQRHQLRDITPLVDRDTTQREM